MKARIATLALVAVGAGLWIALSNTARFSIKKWDAKFESVLRHAMNSTGLDDQNLIDSVHEVRKDVNGSWITHRISLEGADPADLRRLTAALERSGADVIERADPDGARRLVVRRGGRVYQEIVSKATR